MLSAMTNWSGNCVRSALIDLSITYDAKERKPAQNVWACVYVL